MNAPGAESGGMLGQEEEQHTRNSPTSSVCYLGQVESELKRILKKAEGPPTNDHGANTVREPSPRQPQASDNESDITPRSEAPEAPSCAETPADYYGSTTGNYFSPRPMRVYPTYLPTSAPASADTSPIQSLNASTTSIDKHLEHPSPSSTAEHNERPSVHRDFSDSSTASSTTVKGSVLDHLMRSSASQLPHREYPNQAYSALQSQRYPSSYHPRQLSRALSCHPSDLGHHPPSHAVASGHPQDHGFGETRTRTAGNSPIGSPGLFTPSTPPARPLLGLPDEHGFYSSPYLHFTQRQAPKETHIADVDVDPISGRKVINHYEVIDELGRGVHGKVKLGRNLQTGQYVAIKIVERYSKKRRLGKNTSQEDKIKKEIAILKKARHDNIVSLLEVIDDPAVRKVYIILEHVELGEVKWRHEAEKEIALVEYHRIQREAAGIFDNAAAAMEDERILQVARRRREQKERRRAREIQRRAMRAAGPEAWSLEHGGDTDDDISDFDTASRVSTAGSERERGEGLEVLANRHTLAASPSPMPPLAEDEMATLTKDGEEALERSKASNSSLKGLTDKPSSVSPTGLEGTMYGAYEPVVARGRTPSVAGSAASGPTWADDGGEIPEHFRYVPVMTLSAARQVLRDTVLGLEYLHFQGVIHRDIKPANLLQTRDHKIKISDFGVSYLGRGLGDYANGELSESDAADIDEAVELAKTVGTPAFYAPELCQTDPDPDVEAPPVTGQIDVWALGVTLFCLVFGRVPFHANDTFALMRRISEDPVYIPRQRLKAVDEGVRSRPSSHGRLMPMNSNKRAPHDLEYEDIGEDLHHLLRRLLEKDPRRRITLHEVKCHSWLLADLDARAWLELTNVDRREHGRRIEVSKEDVDKAVVPLNLIERMLSGTRSGIRRLGGALGLGKGDKSRKRAQSSATNPDTGPPSAASSSSTISQDARRPSLKVDEQLFSALKASRAEGEHPLSQSVTASPEPKEHSQFFLEPSSQPSSRPETPNDSSEKVNRTAGPTDRKRPVMERAKSTSASIKTIKPSDLPRTDRAVSHAVPPPPLSTPIALDTASSSSLSGLLGGAGRRIIRNMRSRERSSTTQADQERTKSIDRVMDRNTDAHGEPSLALSNAVAEGHVNLPEALQEISPAPSSVASPTSPQRNLHVTDNIVSRHSSLSSASSRPSRRQSRADPPQPHQSPPQATGACSSLPRETSDDRITRAREEQWRRRVLEDSIDRDRPGSAHFSRPTSALGQGPCPPSPDDQIFLRQEMTKAQADQASPLETSPTSYPLGLQSGPVTSNSSEDHFASRLSQSTSNPSIPSVISASSSIVPDDGVTLRKHSEAAEYSSGDTATEGYNSAANYSSGETANPPDRTLEEDDGYAGDHAVESEDEDDSDEDELLMMNPRKHKGAGHIRSNSISNAQLARKHAVHGSGASSIKSARSGSNGTVKKVPRSQLEVDD
ncbi:CAMKK/ELM protein kinase [Coniosporium apollinis CBS 100218]|uniref:non-specific serine/threonine protein kinase n=1 Tax=Coniosporium apollinis (strain CBS 100218) TaxID=1168221 RepID=R7YLD9_CONA1|nr:CAMKK/ELM protein kinase [Coniosporium apollinis CBS 100218]EON62742.1 CAMKK/ELM protein kinase [Coniosporium apollinis CBS 100218]